MNLIYDVFPNYGFRKTLLDKCLKSRISEERLTSNMVNGIKSAELSMTLFSTNLLIILKAIKFEKVSLSDRRNLRTVF